MDFDTFRLAASTADLAAEPRARGYADLVEYRMDLADDPLAALDGYGGALPLLCTNRASWEGGAADEDGRLETLETAVEHPDVIAVDLELTSIMDGADSTLERARAHGVSVIASVHDFEGTPTDEVLAARLAEAADAGDVGKLAVTAEEPGDVLRLLSATLAASAGGATVATMAMGEAGRHSRAIAPLYGSRIGYAPIDPDEATAPGQYDLETLAGLVERLGGRPGDTADE